MEELPAFECSRVLTSSGHLPGRIGSFIESIFGRDLELAAVRRKFEMALGKCAVAEARKS